MKPSDMRMTLLGGAFAMAVSGLAFPTNSQAANELPGTGVTVQITQPDDQTGWILSETFGQLLEKLGYSVPDPLTLAVPVAYQAVSDGSAELYPYGWFPLHHSFMGDSNFNAEPVGYVVEKGALQGYLVDKESAEKFDIMDLDDFRRPEVREAFDRNGNGKADLVACPPGWGCEVMIAYQLDAFELRDDIDPIKAGYSASMADAIGAYQAGESIFFYTWTPNWTVNILKPGEDVVWIQTPRVDLPEDQRDLADTATVSGVEGCVADPCRLGWPVNDIRVLANKDFVDSNPAAKTLLEEVSVPLEFLYKQNAEMHEGANSAEDLQRQAAEWIEENQDQVDAWLDAARASAE